MLVIKLWLTKDKDPSQQKSNSSKKIKNKKIKE